MEIYDEEANRNEIYRFSDWILSYFLSLQWKKTEKWKRISEDSYPQPGVSWPPLKKTNNPWDHLFPFIIHYYLFFMLLLPKPS